MPSSEPWRISHVAEFIYRLQPQSILDIGIGFGKWGALAREYTDVTKGRCAKQQWQARIDGIEIFATYESVLWAVYDQVHIGDAVDILPKLQSYDLIMAIEVLEHIKREDALKMMVGIKAKSKHYIISYSNSLSEATFGNKYEAHVSKWNPRDFPGCKLLCSARAGMSEVYIGKGNLN
jgi:2-polyprenyl-3-methyl-5-hydroxy-6-metoxy-1,4-benzoquinol methylase